MPKPYRPLRSALTRRWSDLRVGARQAERRAYTAGPEVWLTFDDDGTPERVDAILRTLRDHDARAMFFVIGQWAERNAGVVETIRQAGHVLGRHTWTHPDLLALSDAAVRDEIDYPFDGDLIRPPRGRFDARIRRLAHASGLRLAYWTVDSDDWQGVDADYIVAKVVAETRPGGVVLFHIHAPSTLEALPRVIAGLRARGLVLARHGEAR